MADRPGVAVMEAGALEFRADAAAVDERRESRETVGTPFSDTPRMTCRNVNVYYGDNHAIKNVSLDIGREQVLAMIGPSGCGKSTFLRALNRMNDTIDGCRMTGEITLDGKDIYTRDMDVVQLRAQVGMVFQKPNPFPMSIFENVVYPLRVDGIRDKRLLEETCERTLRDAALWDEVSDRLQDNALGLSGGQQQRLCIARAIASEPEIILMDEPCSALDPIATARIEDLIAQLKEHFSIVIVTHNMQQAARVSDNTAFMFLGRLIEYGETKKIFMNPMNVRTSDYITGRFG